MDIAVPSRFACLKIEDDDSRPQNLKPKEAAKKKILKKITKKPAKEIELEKIVSVKKASNNKQISNSASSGKKDKKDRKLNAQQWEEWKRKDNEIVNGSYEEDLQNAILLSKLDYENKKEFYKQLGEADEKEKPQNKKKKNKAMSLDQFLKSDDNKNIISDIPPKTANGENDNFFENIQLEVKKELNKEHLNEKRKKQEVNIDEIISLAQCREKLDQERSKNFTLQLELEKTKTEITAVKERNRTLCGILGHGEMKDKAGVLLELERLNAVKNELTEEVSRLHALLEQERSKVAALSSDSHNNKHKEKVKDVKDTKRRKQKGT